MSNNPNFIDQDTPAKKSPFPETFQKSFTADSGNLGRGSMRLPQGERVARELFTAVRSYERIEVGAQPAIKINVDIDGVSTNINVLHNEDGQSALRSIGIWWQLLKPQESHKTPQFEAQLREVKGAFGLSWRLVNVRSSVKCWDNNNPDHVKFWDMVMQPMRRKGFKGTLTEVVTVVLGEPLHAYPTANAAIEAVKDALAKLPDSELEKFMPRDENNQPVSDDEAIKRLRETTLNDLVDDAPFTTPAKTDEQLLEETAADWAKDQAQMDKFQESVGNLATAHNIPKDVYYPLAHDILSVKSFKHVKDQMPAAILKIKTGFANWKPENKVSGEANAEIKNAPISNEKAANLNDSNSQVSQEVKSENNMPETKIPENIIPFPTQSTEAGVVVFPSDRGEVVYQNVRYNVTIRANGTAEQAIATLQEWGKFWQMASAHGISYAGNLAHASQPPSAPGPQMSVLPPAQHTAPQDTTQGKASCALIKLDTAFKSGKLQLQFECDGMEHPLRYTKNVGEMVKLLANVKKADGNPFTADDLQTGRKFGGLWYVTWKANEGQDGQTYRNVVSVTSA